jgi:hypothetical protein
MSGQLLHRIKHNKISAVVACINICSAAEATIFVMLRLACVAAHHNCCSTSQVHAEHEKLQQYDVLLQLFMPGCSCEAQQQPPGGQLHC